MACRRLSISESLKSWFYSIPLKIKLCSIVFGFAFILFTVLGTILITLANHSLRERELSSAKQTAIYCNLLIEKEQSYLEGIVSHLSSSTDVQKLMRGENLNSQDKNDSGSLVAISKLKKNILHLTLYDLNGRVIDHVSIDASYGPLDQDPTDICRPFGRLISGKEVRAWEYLPDHSTTYLTQDNSPKLSLWHLVRDNYTFRPIGVIVVSMDTRIIWSHQAVTMDVFATTVVLDEHGTIIFPDDKGLNLDLEKRTKLLSNTPNFEKSGCFQITLDNSSYYTTFSRIPETSLVTYILTAKKISWGRWDVYWMASLGGLAVCLLLLLPLMLLTTEVLTKPLRILTEKMALFKEGNINIEVNFKGKDEIGTLGKMFDDMVKKHNTLVQEKYLLTIRRQELEIAVMRAQVDPHFIYNMLNTVYWIAVDTEQHDLALMLHEMATLIRPSINCDQGCVSVQQEIDLLHSYIYLQEKRFGNRIIWKTHFEPECMTATIPRLILQPLVENSITHGLKRGSDFINIRIEVSKIEDTSCVCIEVEDDGAGIPSSILKLLPDKVTTGSASSERNANRFALKNISDRLKLYYGESNYTFQITSEPGSGTNVRISLPFHESETVIPHSTSDVLHRDNSEKEEKNHEEIDKQSR